MEQVGITPEIESSLDQIDYKRNFWNSEIGEAVEDIIQSIKIWRIWWYMACADVRRRYRRTVLGPFWTTLSLSIFIGSASIIFSKLWKMDLTNYMPFFSSGFISFTFVSSIITEGCAVFIMNEGFIKQIPMPYHSFGWHLVTRNFLILLHHLAVYILIVWAFRVPVNFNTLLFVPAIILLFLTGVWVSMLVGLICTRFRDLQQVIMSLLQISIFVTPIFWPASQLGESPQALMFLNVNIIYHYVNIARMSLLGQSAALYSWLVVVGVTILGWILTTLFFARKRRYLAFWL